MSYRNEKITAYKTSNTLFWIWFNLLVFYIVQQYVHNDSQCIPTHQPESTKYKVYPYEEVIQPLSKLKFGLSVRDDYSHSNFQFFSENFDILIFSMKISNFRFFLKSRKKISKIFRSQIFKITFLHEKIIFFGLVFFSWKLWLWRFDFCHLSEKTPKFATTAGGNVSETPKSGSYQDFYRQVFIWLTVDIYTL